MGKRRTSLVVAVVWVMLVAEKCRGWDEGVVEDVKDNMSQMAEDAKLDEKAEAVKSGASDVYNDVKDKAESWSNWAYDKFSKGLGLNGEEIKETAHYVADKAGDAATKTSEKAGEAVKAASEAADNLKSKSEDLKTKAKETLVNGKDKAAEVYEAAKECVNCEGAKEMASQTAGEIGPRIREKTAEL